MKSIYLFFVATIVPTLAFADIEPTCEELWFSRNAMLNDAGFCFSTPLGRSLFDNSDCTTRAPAISAEVAEQISRIQALERNAPYVDNGVCRVDTNQTSLPGVAQIDLRKRLTFHPSTDGSAGACIGYRGDPIDLRAAPDEMAEVLGQITVGAAISDRHLPWNDWNFAIAQPAAGREGPVVLGWYRGDVTADAAMTGVSANCELLAG